MTDYNLLAKAEIEKYAKPISHDGNMSSGLDYEIIDELKIISFKAAQENAATAVQDIIDVLYALENAPAISDHYDLQSDITYYEDLKTAILNYKI